MIRCNSNFCPIAIRVRHNWCKPTMEGSEHQGMQLPICGLMGKWICSKLALGSGMLFPDPVVGYPDPFIDAALLSLAGSHLCSRCWVHIPITILIHSFLIQIVAPSRSRPQCPSQHFRKELPTCSRRLSLLAGLPGSCGYTARRSLERRASLLWQRNP
jgi:hypothetical protein